MATSQAWTVKCYNQQQKLKRDNSSKNSLEFSPEFQKFTGIPAKNSAHNSLNASLLSTYRVLF